MLHGVGTILRNQACVAQPLPIRVQNQCELRSSRKELCKKTNSLTRSPAWKISKTLIKGHCFCLMPDGIKQLRGNISLPGTSKNHLIGKKINGISRFTVPSKCHLKQAHLTHHDEFPSIFLLLGQLYSSSCCGTRWYSHLHGKGQVFIVNRETRCPWKGILKKV